MTAASFYVYMCSEDEQPGSVRTVIEPREIGANHEWLVTQTVKQNF